MKKVLLGLAFCFMSASMALAVGGQYDLKLYLYDATTNRPMTSTTSKAFVLLGLSKADQFVPIAGGTSVIQDIGALGGNAESVTCTRADGVQYSGNLNALASPFYVNQDGEQIQWRGPITFQQALGTGSYSCVYSGAIGPLFGSSSSEVPIKASLVVNL